MLRPFARLLPLLALVACAGSDPEGAPPPRTREGSAVPRAAREPGPRVLFLLTSHGELGSTGKPTGAWLGEVTHAHEVFARAGARIEYASPRGGEVPLDGVDRRDPINAAFLDDPARAALLERTTPAREVEAEEYDAIYLPGGHGTMFDLRGNDDVARLVAGVYDKGGVVGAVCHGPAGLLDVELRNGLRILEGRKVTGFTNAEEAAVKLAGVMPFLLEDALQEQGATFVGAPAWQENVIVDGRLVTGQNPASAAGVARAMLKLLSPRESK